MVSFISRVGRMSFGSDGSLVLTHPEDGWPAMRALLLASLRQGEMQDGLPLRGSGYPDTPKNEGASLFQSSAIGCFLIRLLKARLILRSSPRSQLRRRRERREKASYSSPFEHPRLPSILPPLGALRVLEFFPLVEQVGIHSRSDRERNGDDTNFETVHSASSDSSRSFICTDTYISTTLIKIHAPIARSKSRSRCRGRRLDHQRIRPAAPASIGDDSDRI